MSLFRRKPGGPWYYLFYVAGKPYKKSTKTRNETEAERIEKRAYVAAEKGESLTPPGADTAGFHQRVREMGEDD